MDKETQIELLRLRRNNLCNSVNNKIKEMKQSDDVGNIGLGIMADAEYDLIKAIEKILNDKFGYEIN